MAVNFDEWREVVNGPQTYQQIVCDLQKGGAVIVGWTDGSMTHHDVLFTLAPAQHGSLQGGLRGRSNLFVSVMRRGCFGFQIEERELHPGYIAEKLGASEKSPTCIALTELINGIMRELTKESALLIGN